MRSVANLTRRDARGAARRSPPGAGPHAREHLPARARRRRARGPPRRRFTGRGGDRCLSLVRRRRPAARRAAACGPRPAPGAAVSPGSVSSMRAPPSGEAPADDRAAVGVGDRAHDREAEAGAAGGAVARGVGAVEAVGRPRSRWSAGIPGPSSSTRKRTRSPGERLHRAAAPARSRARCGRSRCRSGCAAPGRGGRGRRAASPRAPGRARSAASASRLIPSHSSLDVTGAASIRLDPQELGLLALGEQQQVVDEAADARDLGLHERLDAAHLLAPTDRAWAASTSSCPRITVSGVRSSCEASATNARCPANASVRRSSMWLKASASTSTSLASAAAVLDARVQVAGVHARGHRGHPAQRARDARADQVGGEQRRRRARAGPRG